MSKNSERQLCRLLVRGADQGLGLEYGSLSFVSADPASVHPHRQIKARRDCRIQENAAAIYVETLHPAKLAKTRRMHCATIKCEYGEHVHIISLQTIV